MSTQISLKLSEKMFDAAKSYAEEKGYDGLQDLIRELLREKLFEKEEVSSYATYLASQPALAKRWMMAEEDKAWDYLQKEK